MVCDVLLVHQRYKNVCTKPFISLILVKRKRTNHRCFNELLDVLINEENLFLVQSKFNFPRKMHTYSIILHYGIELNIKICSINILCVSNFGTAAAAAHRSWSSQELKSNIRKGKHYAVKILLIAIWHETSTVEITFITELIFTTKWVEKHKY